MFDRLLSGAGAVAYLTERVVGRFIRLGTAAPLLVAIVLGALAIGSLSLGIEASGNPNPQVLEPAGIATTGDYGLRTYSTISGQVYATYVETYEDTNDNGQQDPDETAKSWFYWLVDPDSRSGVTVRSRRSPDEIFHYQATGTVYRAADYVAPDLQEFAGEISLAGLQFDPEVLVDASGTPGAGSSPYPWDSPPADESVVSVTGTALGSLGVCSSDTNGNGTCDDAEVDGWDVLVYDPATKRGVIVYTTTVTEFFPATFTGMLRRDAKVVDEAQHPDEAGFDFGRLRLTVSAQYFLDDGTKPASAPLAYGAAAVLGVIAVVILVGRLAGYLVFRPAARPLPGHARTIAVDERLPVRITGTLISRRGREHVREAAGDLVRIALAPPTDAAPPTGTPGPDMSRATPAPDTAAPPSPPVPPPPPAPAEPPPSTLIVERGDRAAGLAVGRGEITALTAGRVVPFRGPRPAIRLETGTGRLTLSFDSAEACDRAVAELLDEGGLGGGLTGSATLVVGTGG